MKCVRYEAEKGIVTITINRPDKRNALNMDAIHDLNQCMNLIEENPNVRVVILTGEGDKAFIAGGDIKEFDALKTYKDVRPMFDQMHNVLHRFSHLPVPLICAINGVALGGGAEVAMACDYRIAADTAKIGFVQVKLGIMTAWGGGPRLIRHIGRDKALHLLVTGEVLSAQEAYDMGIVEKVVPAADLKQEARALAEKIAKNPPMAVRAIKQLAADVEMMPLRSAVQYEAEMVSRLWCSGDHQEAVNAFLEKREPVFKGE